MAANKGVFSDDELRTLIGSLVPDTSRQQAIKFVRWCERTRIHNVILEHILKGNSLTKVGRGGEPSHAGKTSASAARGGEKPRA